MRDQLQGMNYSNMVAEQVFRSTQDYGNVKFATMREQVMSEVKEQSNLFHDLIQSSHETSSSELKDIVKQMGTGIVKNIETKIEGRALAYEKMKREQSCIKGPSGGARKDYKHFAQKHFRKPKQQ